MKFRFPKFFVVCFVLGQGALCALSFATDAAKVDASANYPSRSMLLFKETARDLLFARKGHKDLCCALLREKRFLAGNQIILNKINRLEEDFKKQDASNQMRINDGAILNIVTDITSHRMHEDENLEIQEISLDDKLLAINDIIIIYQSFLEGRNGYESDSILPLIRFWQQFAHLFKQQMNQG